MICKYYLPFIGCFKSVDSSYAVQKFLVWYGLTQASLVAQAGTASACNAGSLSSFIDFVIVSLV